MYDILLCYRAANINVPKPPSKASRDIQVRRDWRRKREAGQTIEEIANFEEKLKMMQIPRDDGG